VGVVVIAAVYGVAAAAMAVAAILVVVAPDLLEPVDLPAGASATRHAFTALPMFVGAAFLGAIGYDLKRLHERGRRVAVFLLSLTAVGRGLELLDDPKVYDAVGLIAFTAAAMYLTRPHAKRLSTKPAPPGLHLR
jgi:hypothetical protein